MPVDNLLPPLAEDPRDVRGPWPDENAAEADEVVYRLGLKAVPVPGLPDTTTIDDIEVAFVHGPVRAQKTDVRQRHKLPVVFDKRMTRDDVGEGELMAIFSLRRSPVPEDLEEAFRAWRARALAAAGMLATVLDERVAGEECFEDAVLLRGGEFVGAADMRGSIRTLLPFEVNAADRSALDQLRVVSLSEASAVARAARLYRRAALEGPTADAYAMLWVAAECFSEHRSPSRKDIETALEESGLNPEGLPISVGRLIELRGKIQHHGLEEDDRLRTAYYEMEAVVRALIRREMHLRGGWWPAPDNPAGFAEPFDHAVATFGGPGKTEWHREALPPAESPEPQRLPRRVPNAVDDPRLDVDVAFGGARALIAGAVIDAIEWQDPDASITVRRGLQPDKQPGLSAVANASEIRLASERIDRLEDADRVSETIVNLVWDLHSLVAAVLAQRAGIVSDGAGAAAVEAIGAWSQYRRLVSYGEFDASLLQLPAGRDPVSLGKLAGWAAAGDARAAQAGGELGDDDAELVTALIRSLREHAPGAPTELLDMAGIHPRSGAS